MLTVIWLVPRWDGGPKGKKMRSSLGEEEFESVFYRQQCTKIVGNCLCQLEMRVTPYNSKRLVTLGLASPPYPHHTPCHALWQSSSPDFHRSGGSLLHIVNSGSSLWIPHVLFLFHASGADVDKVCVWENGWRSRGLVLLVLLSITPVTISWFPCFHSSLSLLLRGTPPFKLLFLAHARQVSWSVVAALATT